MGRAAGQGMRLLRCLKYVGKALLRKCKGKSDIEPCYWLVEEMLTDEEIVDHVQHMGCEEMDVELIGSDDDGVNMGPSKMTLVECRESLKGIANFVAQDVCLGDEDLLQVQQLANKLLAMQATCVKNRKQEVINKFFPVVGI